MDKNFLSKKGFTLVELAVVLVILGLLLGLGAGMVGMLTKRAKLTETRERVKTVYNAIIGYATANKELPSSLQALGIITKDPYGQDLQYYAAGGITSSNFCTTQGTYLTVNDRGTNKTDVAFVVFSIGENRCNQTGTSSPFQILEPGTDTTCPQGTLDYDDTVKYLDIDALREAICNPFRITTESLPIGTEEYTYPSTTLEATDGTPSYSWSLSAGSLPPGLSLSSSGGISGTPTADGSYNFTVQVTDAEGRTATKSLTITINPNDPWITTEFLHYGTVGNSYTAVLGATGGTGSYTWSLISGSLPPGLSLSDNTISGTPSSAGTYSFTIKITDGRNRTAQKTLSIAIN